MSQYRPQPSQRQMLTEAPLFALTHRGDPDTSREAAARAPRKTHLMMVLEAIRRRPGCNAYEIGAAIGLDHVQVDRRVHSLLKLRVVRRDGKRNGASCLWPKGDKPCSTKP